MEVVVPLFVLADKGNYRKTGPVSRWIEHQGSARISFCRWSSGFHRSSLQFACICTVCNCLRPVNGTFDSSWYRICRKTTVREVMATIRPLKTGVVIGSYDFYRATAKHTHGFPIDVCRSVCPSVCPSNACIVTKRKHLAKKVQLWLIGSRPRAFQWA